MQWIKQQLSNVIGEKAERLACEFLQKQGLKLVCKNYRCRTGEIDLVMKEQDEFVFVEVKYRSNADFGQALEYFHIHKRKKFQLAVSHFMHEKGLNPTMVDHRIDVIAIDNTNIEWLKSV